MVKVLVYDWKKKELVMSPVLMVIKYRMLGVGNNEKRGDGYSVVYKDGNCGISILAVDGRNTDGNFGETDENADFIYGALKEIPDGEALKFRSVKCMKADMTKEIEILIKAYNIIRKERPLFGEERDAWKSYTKTEFKDFVKRKKLR